MKPTFILINEYAPFLFSATPLDMRIKTGQRTQTINIIEFGELTNVGDKVCDTITFSSFFPSLKSPFYSFENPLLPQLCVKTLEKWKEDKDILTFVIPEFFIAKKCKIVNFNHIYDERTGDINFEIKLKEVRNTTTILEDLGIRER